MNPELIDFSSEELIRNEVNSVLQSVKDAPAAGHHHTLQGKIAEARELGVDVSDVEAQMPELLKMVEQARVEH